MRIIEKEMVPIFTLSIDGVIIYAKPAALRMILHLKTGKPVQVISHQEADKNKYLTIGTNYNDLLGVVFENTMPDVIEMLNINGEIRPGSVKGCVFKLHEFYDIIGLKNEFIMPRGQRVAFLQSRWIDISSVERAVRMMMVRFGYNRQEDIDQLVEILLNHEKRALLALADIEELRDVEIAGPHILTVYECTKTFSDLLLSFYEANPEIKDQPGYILPQDFTSENFGIAATLHDIGKVTTPDEVLRKPGKFFDDEWEIMKLHTIAGANIIQELKKSDEKAPLYKMAFQIAKSHHEKWAGGSYPEGLKGLEIPIEARITAIIDVFDALLTDRYYKKSWSLDEVKEQFETDLNRLDDDPLKQFDPILLKLFLAHFDVFVNLKEKVENEFNTRSISENRSAWLDKTVDFIIKVRERRLKEENIVKRDN